MHYTQASRPKCSYSGHTEQSHYSQNLHESKTHLQYSSSRILLRGATLSKLNLSYARQVFSAPLTVNRVLKHDSRYEQWYPKISKHTQEYAQASKHNSRECIDGKATTTVWLPNSLRNWK